jgi:hypothetical protein
VSFFIVNLLSLEIYHKAFNISYNQSNYIISLIQSIFHGIGQSNVNKDRVSKVSPARKDLQGIESVA